MRGQRFLNIHTDEQDDDNRRKWRYSLNFRGFLLYLVAESQARGTDKRRIRRVLSNPMIIAQSPFLQGWPVFEQAGFDVTGTLTALGREFQNQLDYDIQYLLRRVADRYFIAFSNYFDRLQAAGSFHLYIKRVDLETDRKIREYRLRMYRQQRASLAEEAREIDRWIAIFLKVKLSTLVCNFDITKTRIHECQSLICVFYFVGVFAILRFGFQLLSTRYTRFQHLQA
jgi:hypothetical protein